MMLPGFISHLFRREAVHVLEARDPEAVNIITLISIIFSTAPQTFTGDASYITLATPTTAKAKTTATGKTTSTRRFSSVSETTHPLLTSSSTTATTMLTTTAPTTSATLAPVTTKAPEPTVTPKSGMSTGGKVGLAFAIILIILFLAAGAIALYRKRKAAQVEKHQKLDDEKTFFAGSRKPDSLPSFANPQSSNPSPVMPSTASMAPVAPPAPIVGGRPGSWDARGSETISVRGSGAPPQLNLNRMSGFNGGMAPNAPSSYGQNSTSAFPAYGAAAAVGAGAATGAYMSRDVSPPVSYNANDPSNPFGNHAEKLNNSPPQEVPLPVSPVTSSGPSTRSSAPNAADFPMPEWTPSLETSSTTTLPKADTAAVVAVGAASGAAAIMAATTAAASNKPQGPAIVPGSQAPDNVHRVQLDFKPSMEDELEVRAGQLIRVLHEYDDGWALCIRMDRAAQGVVPRTCLSKQPVKPRPQSPNRGPRGPQMPGSGRNSPSQGRMSPGPYAQAPRPLTPTSGRPRANSNAPFVQPQQRSMSPGPYGGSKLRPQDSASAAAQRRRSNSMSNLVMNGSTMSLPQSKIPTRKPVPSSGSSASTRSLSNGSS